MTPSPLINMGDCYYCEKPVMAIEGDSVPQLREIMKSKIDGHIIRDTLTPAHEECKVINSGLTD